MNAIARYNGGFEIIKLPEVYTPEWWNSGVYVNSGDGNPVTAAFLTHVGNVGVTFGDFLLGEKFGLREFSLPVSIIAKNFKIMSITASTGKWRHAIYRRGDRALVWDSGYTNTIATGWNSYPMGNLALTANTPYWYVLVSNDSVYDLPIFRVPTSIVPAQKYVGSGTPPIGNLGIGLPSRYTCYLPTGQEGTLPSVLPANSIYASSVYGSNYDYPFGYITTF